MLGLVVSLREQYRIRTNWKSGERRYYMMLSPKQKEKSGILLEFKIKERKEERKKTLDHAAEQALKQIKKKRYETELLQAEISSVLKYGIAFNKKKVAIKGTEEIKKILKN